MEQDARQTAKHVLNAQENAPNAIMDIFQIWNLSAENIPVIKHIA